MKKFYGFDLHDTVLITQEASNKKITIPFSDEFQLRSSKEYFQYWYKKDGRTSYIQSIKKYQLLESYDINSEFIEFLKNHKKSQVFIFSNCGDIEDIVKLKFPILRDIRFFSAGEIGCFKPNSRSFEIIKSEMGARSDQILYCGDNI